MKRYVYSVKLRDIAIEPYKKYHENCPPQVEAALIRVGIKHMQTYLLNNILVTILDTEDSFDPINDIKNYSDSKEVDEWDAIMATLQIPHDGCDGWTLMEKVYDLDK